MPGPLIGGRRPISWRLAIVVAFVTAYATAPTCASWKQMGIS